MARFLSFLACLIATLIISAAPAHADRITISESPLSIFGEDARAFAAPGFDVTENIIWDVYIPDSPHEATPGALIYISPADACHLPDGWTEVLDARNLIWICARNAGNSRPTVKRMLGALGAGSLLARDRTLNAERIYLSGFSGGGRVASIVITQSPQLFSGAVYFSGVNDWETEDETLIAEIVQRRFVFVTGRKDFNRADTRAVHHRYGRAGAGNTLLMDLPRLGHELPGAEDFERAVAFLDSD